LEDIFVPLVVPHPIFEVNRMEVSKVQLESWHVAMAKLHDRPTRPASDQANVVHGVVVMHNNEGMV
jgi:hypothetical protein